MLAWRIAFWPGNCHVKIDAILLGGLSQFAHGPSLELPDPFLGHAHYGPNLLQRERRLAAGETESTGDNLQLPLIQTAKDLLTCDSR